MAKVDEGMMLDQMERSHWIRLRTLITLRWVALAGQMIAIATARYYFDLQLELGLCYMAIGAGIISNLLAVFIFPENKRLSESEAMMTLLFDVTQLSFLIFLSGGMNNPFTLLVMAPVAIASTVLNFRSALILSLATMFYATILTFYFIPLRTEQGFIMRMPDIFRYGFWVSILIGVCFLSVSARRIATEINTMSDALLATQMALSREQKLTDLGGVVAAAAHELGTPLATIKLVSSELIEELDDRPELKEDAALIREQTERCREILRSMGRAGKDDLHLRMAPLDTVIREAAEPHSDRGSILHFDIAPGKGGEQEQPTIQRQPEIIHGLRNLVQNAVDFSKGNVWITVRWTEDRVRVRILDDGKGFPPYLLGRIGDPFMSSRKTSSEKGQRPGYEGMGLGLFIAKTLLERTGAEMTFANASDIASSGPVKSRKTGALVEASWPLEKLIPAQAGDDVGLGENIRFEVG